MKIAINTGHGGFGLSPKAVELLAKKNNKSCYFFSVSREDGKRTYIQIPLNQALAIYWYAFTVTNPGEHNYSDIVLTQSPEDRSDPKLIEVIEELGKEANGEFAKIKIVNIPDGMSYEICGGDDGDEWIQEKCRKWC